MGRLILSFSLIIIGSINCFSQIVHRTYPAVRTNQKIVIDGVIDDSAWKKAPLATGFVEFRPNIGMPEDERNKTEVWMLYDNTAIYVAGFCHESSDSISTELVGRDAIRSNDFVGVLFDTYHDEINGFGYYITPLGEQYDAKYSSNGEDGSWNSVYLSEAKIVAGGWTFEMKIPYSAIRFGNKSPQDWGINITRRRAKSGRQLLWNALDPKINGLFIQAGLWKNIENVKPPLRLSLSPYFSSYANHYPYNEPGRKNWSSSVNGGMDVKYGINQSFTLDMTLVPDFGQVQSDNKVLNLTPFEVKYNEYRTFFTEGTELFSKGNLFYSRRIGSTPLHYYRAGDQLNSNERLIKNPSETRLINATKISGRNANGLGIGFFNAIVNSSYALAEDNSSKVQRRIETSPLTNYNIVVLDQALKHNSSISFINTNVWRSGADYDANVSAALFDLYDKNVKYNFSGKVGISQLMGYKPDKGNLNGYNHVVSFGKTAGNFTWFLSESIADKNYQQNDLGYFTNNNYFNHASSLGYKLLKPKSFYNNLFFNINTSYNRRFDPGTFQNFFMNTNINGQLKNLWQVGIAFNLYGKENDFYEPRLPGKFFKRPAYTKPSFWINTNFAKKYALGIEAGYTNMPAYRAKGFDLQFNQQFRFNNKFTISNSANIEYVNRNIGFATVEADSSIFGLRKRNTVENTFNIKYNFTNKMGLTLRARHYWSTVNYTEFFNLENDGSVKSIARVSNDPNSNVNYFNIDMVYTWQFALGSFINIVWKDAASTFDNQVQQHYLKNFAHTWAEPQSNSLSFRIIYYLDYLSLHGKK